MGWSGISDTPVTFCNRVWYDEYVNGKRKASPKTSGKAPTMDIKAFWAENHLGFTTRNGCEIFCTSHIFKDREKMQLLKQHGDELVAYARSVVGDDCTEWTEKGRWFDGPDSRRAEVSTEDGQLGVYCYENGELVSYDETVDDLDKACDLAREWARTGEWR